jgi:hypothetical protein
MTMGGLQDLFKRMNAELKKSVDMTLAKANRSTQFDIAKVRYDFTYQFCSLCILIQLGMMSGVNNC